ncbi:UNVERIFIED_CONTAM: hypothetical protein RMT77_018847 [Armadillidium vulgare]
MMPGVTVLRVFTPKNNFDMFNVDEPLRMNTSNLANSPQVVNEIETENKIIYDELKGMQKNFHLKLPGVNEVNDNVYKEENESSFDSNDKKRLWPNFKKKKSYGEDESSFESSVTNLVYNNVDKGEDESSFDSNNKPRVGLYFFKNNPNGKDESSSESSVTNPDYEDCDNTTNTDQNTEINQDIKNNSENLPESENKTKISTTTLTSNKVKTSGIPEETVKLLESGESGELETAQNQRQEPEKKSIITPTLDKEANQINLVIVIVTVSVSLILLLIILATIVNHIRNKRHCDLLDIEKFQRENEKEKTPMENNHQDFYRWIKARINPSHCKGQGQNSPFQENNDPHH